MYTNDLENIIRIEKDLFSDAWGRENFEYEINSNEFSKSYVIEIDGHIIGYAILYILFERAEIASIAIDKDYQGRGYGKMLINHLIKEAISDMCEIISLEVRISNFKAIELYKKYGFKISRVRKSYYSDNYEDAYEMFKVLGGNDEKDLCN